MAVLKICNKNSLVHRLPQFFSIKLRGAWGYAICTYKSSERTCNSNMYFPYICFGGTFEMEHIHVHLHVLVLDIVQRSRYSI